MLGAEGAQQSIQDDGSLEREEEQNGGDQGAVYVASCVPRVDRMPRND